MKLIFALLLASSLVLGNNAEIFQTHICESIKKELPVFEAIKTDSDAMMKKGEAMEKKFDAKGKSLGFQKAQIDSLGTSALQVKCPNVMAKMIEIMTPSDLKEAEVLLSSDEEQLANFYCQQVDSLTVLISNYGPESEKITQYGLSVDGKTKALAKELNINEARFDEIGEFAIKNKCPEKVSQMMEVATKYTASHHPKP